MPEMTAAEMQQLLVAQQQRIQAFEAQQQKALVDAAIADALGSAGVELNPGAQQQLVELLRPEVSLISHGGQTIPAGPNLKPVDQFVREKLAAPDFAHFIRGKSVSPATPAHGSQAATAGAVEQQPGETLGAWMIRRVTEQRAAREATHGDPRIDMARPLGLRLPTR